MQVPTTNDYLAKLRGETPSGPPAAPSVALRATARNSDPQSSHEGVAWYTARNFRYHQVHDAAKLLAATGHTWFDDAEITRTVNVLHGGNESRNNLARVRKQVEDDGFLVRSKGTKESRYDGRKRIHFRLATVEDAAPHDHREALKAQARAAELVAEQNTLAEVIRLPLTPTEVSAEMRRIRRYLDLVSSNDDVIDAIQDGKDAAYLFASDIEDVLEVAADAEMLDAEMLMRLEAAEIVEVDGVDHVRIDGHDCYMALDFYEALKYGTETWD